MESIKILHVCSYYIGNKLYSNMVDEISKYETFQHIYVPVRDKKHIGRNQLQNQPLNTLYYYSYILDKTDRLFYFKKIKKQAKDIESKLVNVSKFDIIHAHTLYSDGGTAYELYKRHGLNYIVTVRNTDLNYFHKYLPYLRRYMYKILRHSKKIVFISKSYETKFKEVLPKKVLNKNIHKFQVIPNGIDDYWHNNILTTKKNLSRKINLLYIGTVNKNKNLYTVVKVVRKLKSINQDVTLRVIGDGPEKNTIQSWVDKNNLSESVLFLGNISDKNKIKKIMQLSDIFIMVSFTETFGLVFIESFTQGLPAIYSKDEGIDGFFKAGNVGYPVNPNSEEEIVEAINRIINNYSELSENCVEISSDFNWQIVTKQYLELYYRNKNS